jgi:hypothetical protein
MYKVTQLSIVIFSTKSEYVAKEEETASVWEA